MDRCKDYFRFAVWFAGIGYAALWPFSVSGDGGYPFGAFAACRDAGGGAIAALCGLPHPFTLPVGLHVLGFAAAATVTARVSIGLLCRWRQRPGVMPAEALNARLPDAIPARTGMPVRRMRTIKPRKHFGLRGTPR